MSYKIEIGIPVKHSKGRPHIYPFDKMKVGESFFVDVKEGENAKYVQTKLATLARRYALRYCPETKYATSSEKNEERIGVRVWRVS